MKLIDKDALIAEIERLKECNCKICAGDFDFLKKTYPEHYYSTEIYNDILSFINTLEVKEVDLDKEINNFGLHYDGIVLDRKELIEFAKHFFEFGLQAAQKGKGNANKRKRERTCLL